jgi:hypothetical protein
MNKTFASCGHDVWSVGADGSLARIRANTSPCPACAAELLVDRDMVDMTRAAVASGDLGTDAGELIDRFPLDGVSTEEMVAELVSRGARVNKQVVGRVWLEIDVQEGTTHAHA